MSTCPCCAAAGTESLFTVKDHRYVACTTCGSGRLDPMPSFDPTELYGERYFVNGDDRGGYVDYDRDGELHRRNATARLKFAQSWLPPTRPADAVDVGCASGYMLDAYREHGFTPHGVDVSPWAREVVAARGHDVHATLTGAVGASEHLMVVSFFQSLEHLPDPDAAVAEAAGALAPGGVLLMETWDRSALVARVSGAKWQQANPPSVLHLFTRDGLNRLADRHGLHVERLQATSKLVSPALAVGVVAHRFPGVARVATRALAVTHLTHAAVPYRLGDLVSLVAVKR